MRSFPAAIYLFLLFTGDMKAQGCSDAGVCSVGGASLPITDSANISQEKPALFIFRTTSSFSSGEQRVLTFQEIPEIEYYVSKRVQVVMRIPYSINSGSLGNTSGIGDPYVGISAQVFSSEENRVSVIGGYKIPLGKTDNHDQGRSLPMPYQTGLGTSDGLFGIVWLNNQIRVAAVYQHVFKQQNKNEFLHSRWEGIKKAQAYFESNKLKRANDLSLRFDYEFNWKKGKIYTGILSIYRLTEDKITDLNGKVNQVRGSEGLTLNVTASAYYQLTNQQRLTAQIGFPIVVREVRPDGLTRSAVINLIYAIKINKNTK
jgi:hypothetical protein